MLILGIETSCDETSAAVLEGSGDEVLSIGGHLSYVYSVALSPDGKTLASGSGDGTVRLLSTKDTATRMREAEEATRLRAESEGELADPSSGEATIARVLPKVSSQDLVRSIREEDRPRGPRRGALLDWVLRHSSAGPR